MFKMLRRPNILSIHFCLRKRVIILCFLFFCAANLFQLEIAAASIECPINHNVINVVDNLKLPARSAIKLNSEVRNLYQRYYCKDKRTFFNHLDEKFVQVEIGLDEESRQKIEQYRKKFLLPVGGEPSHIFPSDKERIKNFDRIYQGYRKALFPTTKADALENLDVLLVGGIGTDYLRGHTFKDIDHVLKNDYGLSEERIHHLFPSSFSGNESGIKTVKEKLESILKNHPKRKILLIGYSRGGVVSLESLIENTNLLDSIHAVVTVNSPLKGTPVAKMARKVLDKLSNVVANVRKLGSALQFCDCFDAARTDLSQGLRSIEPNESIMNKLQSLSDEDYSKLSKTLFFVTSSTTPFHEPTKMGTYILQQENDGTVPKANQFFNSIGRRLADLQAGHTDLMMSGFKSALNENDRKAFARALIETLTNANSFYDP